jgi:hypothetical protein
MKKIEKELEKEFNESLKDEQFKNLIAKLKISKELGKKNNSKIMDTVEELKTCKNCKGLFMCKNKVNGHVLFPEKEMEQLNFIYTPCKFYKTYLKEIKEKEEKNK